MNTIFIRKKAIVRSFIQYPDKVGFILLSQMSPVELKSLESSDCAYFIDTNFITTRRQSVTKAY